MLNSKQKYCYIPCWQQQDAECLFSLHVAGLLPKAKPTKCLQKPMLTLCMTHFIHQNHPLHQHPWTEQSRLSRLNRTKTWPTYQTHECTKSQSRVYISPVMTEIPVWGDVTLQVLAYANITISHHQKTTLQHTTASKKKKEQPQVCWSKCSLTILLWCLFFWIFLFRLSNTKVDVWTYRVLVLCHCAIYIWPFFFNVSVCAPSIPHPFCMCSPLCWNNLKNHLYGWENPYHDWEQRGQSGPALHAARPRTWMTFTSHHAATVVRAINYREWSANPS